MKERETLQEPPLLISRGSVCYLGREKGLLVERGAAEWQKSQRKAGLVCITTDREKERVNNQTLYILVCLYTSDYNNGKTNRKTDLSNLVSMWSAMENKEREGTILCMCMIW